ncbi:MAG TPA: radical SAM protein [Acidobacteriota bacterium]|nr:radical SAM protein [Acidobacteriota bacterium]
MERPYIYYDLTTTLCTKCLRQIFGKIVFEENKVFMFKTCPEHGMQKVLIESDAEYYRQIRNYVKRSEMPLKFGTPVKYGCPYDCGLCTDHEQHSCLSIVEITDRCNLECPTCYAMSSPTYGSHRTLEEVKKMFDIIVASEGEPDVVQISGGEPTIHPQFFEILDYAKSKPIKHLMLNTNGIKIATEDGFAKRLATYMPAFEVYLQFDSFKADALKKIRGTDLSSIRKKAIDQLNKFNISTTLVVTLQKGVNDDEIGEIIDYALKQQCVRGVTFQPTQVAGRNKQFDPTTDRMTLTEVRQRIIEQSKLFTAKDIVPVPCNPDALAMGYAVKLMGQVFPLTRYVDPELLLNASKNTIVYEHDQVVKKHALEVFSTAKSVEGVTGTLHSLLCCLPSIKAPDLTYKNLFRIIIMKFMDAYDFDVRAIKKSCVHIVHKDGRIIPFETMNLFYRDEKETYLKQLQAEKLPTSGRIIGKAI